MAIVAPGLLELGADDFSFTVGVLVSLSNRSLEYFLGFSKSLTLLCFLASCSQGAENSVQDLEGSAIIGGEAATASDTVTQSTVALVMAKSDILKEQCTGTLISPNLVLTAAHCLEGLRPTNVWVHFGATLPKPFYLNQLTQVADFVVHDEFSPVYVNDFPETELNDIAVVYLKTPAPKEFIPVGINLGLPVKVGDRLLVAGYGHISDRNTVRAKGLNYARVPVSRLWRSLYVLDQTLKSGVCHGDSGGPAYLETDDGLVLAALTRGAHNKSSNCHSYTELTNAKFFQEFILDAAHEMGGVLPRFVE